MAKVTTIQIKPETKERLKQYGKMGMTYDDVINYILDKLEEYERIKKSDISEAKAEVRQ